MRHSIGMTMACDCIMQHASGIPHPKVGRGNPCRTLMARRLSQVRCHVQSHFFPNWCRNDMQHANACRVACRAGMRHANGISCWHAACQWRTSSKKWNREWRAAGQLHATFHKLCSVFSAIFPKGTRRNAVQHVNGTPTARQPHAHWHVVPGCSMPMVFRAGMPHANGIPSGTA